MTLDHELPYGYELIFAGANCAVAIKDRVKRDLLKRATDDKRAALEVLVKRYAEGGPKALPSQRFNANEKWFPSSKAADKVRVQAFKPWQLRAYGFRCDFDGRTIFFITGIDPQKKQDRAKPEILRAAGKEAVRVNNLIQGRS